MKMWTVTYWDGQSLRQVLITADPYNLMPAISASPVGGMLHNLIKVELEPYR